MLPLKETRVSTDTFAASGWSSHIIPQPQRSFKSILTALSLYIAVFVCVVSTGRILVSSVPTSDSTVSRRLLDTILDSSISRSVLNIMFNSTASDASVLRSYSEVTTGAQILGAFTTPSSTFTPPSWVGNMFMGWIIGADYSASRHVEAAELVFRRRDPQDGRCWKFSGARGQLGVRLSEAVQPRSLVISRPLHHQIFNHTSMEAPRHVSVWGIPETPHTVTAKSADRRLSKFRVSKHSLPGFVSGSDHAVNIGIFEVAAASGEVTQTFELMSKAVMNAVIIEILDNWGGTETCIHGASIV